MAILRAMGPRAEVVRAFLDMTEAVLYGPAALGRVSASCCTGDLRGERGGYSAEIHAAPR